MGNQPPAHEEKPVFTGPNPGEPSQNRVAEGAPPFTGEPPPRPPRRVPRAKTTNVSGPGEHHRGGRGALFAPEKFPVALAPGRAGGKVTT